MLSENVLFLIAYLEQVSINLLRFLRDSRLHTAPHDRQKCLKNFLGPFRSRGGADP